MTTFGFHVVVAPILPVGDPACLLQGLDFMNPQDSPRSSKSAKLPEQFEFPRPAEVPSFQVADWQVHPSLNQLQRGGERTHLEPRLMYVLTCLASRPGAVISREQLLRTVWGDTIVCEEALTRAISDLRHAFGDDPQRPCFIETIRKGGYRLVAPVQPLPQGQEALANSAASHRMGGELAPATEALASARRRRTGIVILAVILVMVAGLIWLQSRLLPPPASSPIPGRPLTSYPGRETTPALSPDGKQLAFARDGGHGTGLDIYVQQVGADAHLRLTDMAGIELHPVWSPQGDRIAFIHVGQQRAIYVVPFLGGEPRRLLTGDVQVSGLDWSADGRFLAYTQESAQGYPAVHLLRLADLEVRLLTPPPVGSRGDHAPLFSPDGRQVAILRTDAAGRDDIVLVSSEDGAVQKQIPLQRHVSGWAWSPTSEQMILATAVGGYYGLHRCSLADGGLDWLPTPGRNVRDLSVAREGAGLVYEDVYHDIDVHRLQLADDPDRGMEKESVLDPDPFRSGTPLITSTRDDHAASCSPDGKRIAFLSQRSGASEVWICDSAGRQAWQLTEFTGATVLPPHWDPSGRRLAFSVLLEKRFAVHVMALDAAMPRRLSTGPAHAVLSFWSRNGQWIYFTEGGEAGWRLRRISPQGDHSEDVLPAGYHSYCESLDGLHLYCVRMGDGSIVRVPLAGGEPHVLVPGTLGDAFQRLVAGRDGLFYVRKRGDAQVVEHLNLTTLQSRQVLVLEFGASTWFSISPAERAILFDHGSFESDLIHVTGDF